MKLLSEQHVSDALSNTLEFLDTKSICQCASVNNRLKQETGKLHLWKHLSQRDFGRIGNKKFYQQKYSMCTAESRSEIHSYANEVSELFNWALALVGCFLIALLIPALILLKLDGYLNWSWTTIFCSFHVMTVSPFLYLLLRVALCLQVHSTRSALKRTKQLSFWSTFRVILLNQKVAKHVLMLSGVVSFCDAFPLALNLYLENLLTRLMPVMIPFWLHCGCILLTISFLHISHFMKLKLSASVACVVASSVLLTIKMDGSHEALSWTVVLSPILPIFIWCYCRIFMYLLRIWNGSHSFAEKIALSFAYDHASQYPPITAMLLLWLKLAGFTSMRYSLISADYWSWLLLGPIASVATATATT